MEMFSLGGDLAVCSNPAGRFHGWMFKRHPDGQWVSIAKLDAVALPSTPFAEPGAFTPAQLQIGAQVVAGVGQVILKTFEGITHLTAADCYAPATEILGRLAMSPPITRPGPPDTELFLNRSAVRVALIHLAAGDKGDCPNAADALAAVDALTIVTAGELRERAPR